MTLLLNVLWYLLILAYSETYFGKKSECSTSFGIRVVFLNWEEFWRENGWSEEPQEEKATDAHVFVVLEEIDDDIWIYFQHYCPFLRGIYQSWWILLTKG